MECGDERSELAALDSGESFQLNECGIGALVLWAGKLWMITYGAHHPDGSTHKLYSIDEDLNMTIHPESVGGTPAGRMIHKESNQLILGHYMIDGKGKVRVISPKTMQGKWYTFLLPKAAHNNDPRHGWFTEWPRIREIGKHGMMMDMHGMFYQFPKTFSAANTAGLAPISSHLRYIPDFCDWNGRLVIATDEASIMGHKHCGQPQSNLWFGEFDELKKWGPASGYGGPWVKYPVKGGVPSDPLRVAGFDRRVLHLCASPKAIFTIEIHSEGCNEWQTHASVEVGDYAVLPLPASLKTEWIRITTDRDCEATAYFHGTDSRLQESNEELFAGIADLGYNAIGGLLHPEAKSRNLRFMASKGSSCHEVTREMELIPAECDVKLAETLAVDPEFEVDAASVIAKSKDSRFRLPKGDAAYDQPFAFGWPRAVREVESERNLANIHGSFYEIPRSGYRAIPDWERIRPVASHCKQLHDFCTWQGLLVLSGVGSQAQADGHVFHGDGSAIWCGGVDDLWQLGKPAGQGGPWKDTVVAADEPSDPYLMTGYDCKTLTLHADRDVTVTLEVNVDHQSGWHTYKTFALKTGQPQMYRFPADYRAHWIRFSSDAACIATAWLVYF